MAKTEIIEMFITNDTLLESFVPTDRTDVGQGELLARAYSHRLCYCKGMGWLTYKEGIWTMSNTDAHGYSQKLTTLQLQEAICRQTASIIANEKPDDFIEYVYGRRSSSRVSATLKEAEPMLSIDISELDADPLILNTPSGEVRLDTGEILPHDPAHHITRITTASPSDEGAEIWAKFLLQIACDDETVVDFLQQFAGMAAIGKVYEERLVIAIGSGGNGKSTFFNALQDVLGDYAGTIRSELLIASNDSGKKFEYARLRGKRLIIAEELEVNKQLDTASVKQLCSTGDINAQFKGKDVFTFKPSHSTVLCTNHMPSVKTVDNGTWDRLIVLPFNGRFRNQATEVKNYGAYLVEHCGGAILQWVIDGAQKYIQNDYKLKIPETIQVAINSYQEENDWAAEFFCHSLIFDDNERAMGGELYDAYLKYCDCSGINPLAQAVVLPRIEAHPGVTKKRTNRGMQYKGVGINKPESLRVIQTMKVQRCREEKSLLDLFEDII